MTAQSFDTLRSWDGSQSRAFEELSFQLLKDTVPSGTKAIRTGNPDGGVEWYATQPDGTEHGWQAKHVHGIDALLTAMTGSVERVAKERPQLRKLTFVISSNLATSKAGARGKERKSQREKYGDKVEAWQRSIPGAEHIEFDLVQESDLLNELVKPQHAGRRLFWWGDVVLGSDWLNRRYQEQASAASEKYRPDLQVDIPIQEDLVGLGFGQDVVSTFERHLLGVVAAVDDLHLSSSDDDATQAALLDKVRTTATELRAQARSIRLQSGDSDTVLGSLLAAVEQYRAAVAAADEHARDRYNRWRALPNDDPAKSEQEPESTSGYSARALSGSVDNLCDWLDSSVGRALLSRAYFLSGQAGSGKTHLLLDATRRALDEGRPAVFLAGAQFGRGNLWGSIADQLGLGDVGADALLGAMDSAGEAASRSGRRFLMLVDALNETTPADFWRIHLPALRAAVASHPHVALAVTCRDTYVDLVLNESDATKYLRTAHPGFAEREIEATQRYFAHYKLEVPRIPLLTPEFTLPLFLRLFCESVAQSTDHVVPEGHQGRISIFERFLRVKVDRVARRARPDATSDYELAASKTAVTAVLDRLLDELSIQGRETLSVSDAGSIARAAADGSGLDPTKILGLLQEEGVLTRERLYLGGQTSEEGVRLVFQAFADFLLLKRRMSHSADPLTDDALKKWLSEDCSWGILEAACILFPEAYGAELPDVLGLTPPQVRPSSTEAAEWNQFQRTRQVYRSLVETLPYRETSAITQRTIDHLNDARRFLLRSEFFRVLFTLAPQSASRLNADGLHRYLTRHSMPQRDSDFGFATYSEIHDPFSPASRLAQWAAGGPYPDYSSDVVELACVPLVWLMSSPNRYMRDWTTKALVQLLHGHLDVMQALVERFWPVDDPYVVQRVVAIAYGALLRSSPEQFDAAKSLAETVHRLVFTKPVRADELLLDASRGIVRWAIGHDLLPAEAWDACERPYGLKRPGPPPTEVTLDRKYGWAAEQPDDESYSSLRFSLLSMGDFGRYVVEAGLREFSRFPNGTVYPTTDREPRLLKGRWKKFVDSLTDTQVAQLQTYIEQPSPSEIAPIGFLMRGEDDPLSAEQHALLSAAVQRRKVISDEYDGNAARRWVFRRVISLGWTPKLFGHEDRARGHGRGREAHKAERWGKKYQWIAYHELLARVADNYQPRRRYGEEGPYEGLHQMVGEREIDPSLPPISFRQFNESIDARSREWGSPPVHMKTWPTGRVDFDRFQGDILRFVADTSSEPSIASSSFLEDTDGSDWVVLDSFQKQVDPRAPESWRGVQEATTIDTVLVPSGSAKRLVKALEGLSRHDAHDLIDWSGHTDCCYVGEVGRIGPSCPHRHDRLQDIEFKSSTYPVASTVEQYSWEGNILDCSIEESAKLVLPSTFIQHTAGLTFDPGGPSWLDAERRPAFVYYERPDVEGHALLVRAAFLRDFLAQQDLVVIVLHWWERMELTADSAYDRKHPSVSANSVAFIGKGLIVRDLHTSRAERDLD